MVEDGEAVLQSHSRDEGAGDALCLASSHGAAASTL